MIQSINKSSIESLTELENIADMKLERIKHKRRYISSP
jgi:hypothetical protein